MTLKTLAIAVLGVQLMMAAAPPIPGCYPCDVAVETADEGRAAPPIPGCFPCDVEQQ